MYDLIVHHTYIRADSSLHLHLPVSTCCNNINVLYCASSDLCLIDIDTHLHNILFYNNLYVMHYNYVIWQMYA